MSSVLLMVGQCGNQIGHNLVKLIDSTTDSHLLTHRDGKIRCVCVDSEPKVIKANIADDRKRGHLYRDENVVIDQRGRGNNWALGYHGLLGQETEETSLLHRTLGVLRKEVERCDRFAGSILVHSLTGGTGSGLGSRLLEEIRETFPMAHLVSVAVAPHVSGDSPLQHYNSLLSLASLQRNADGIVMFSNDDVLHSLLARPGNHGKSTLSVSIKQMNQYIATSLAGVLLSLQCKPKRNSKSRSEEKKCSPNKWKCRITRQRVDSGFSSLRGSSAAQNATTVNDSMHAIENFSKDYSYLASEDSLSVMSRQPKRSNSALLRYRGLVGKNLVYEPHSSMDQCYSLSGPCDEASRGNELWDMLASVCPEPAKKFATLHHISKPRVSWDSLGQSLIHSIRRCDKYGEMFSTLGAILVARGDSELTFPQFADKIRERMKSSLRCVKWNPSPLDFWISQYSGAGSDGEASLTLFQNSTSVTETVANTMQKAKIMYDAGAYLHWFWKHGCSEEDFTDAFNTLESVVEEYQQAVT